MVKPYKEIKLFGYMLRYFSGKDLVWHRDNEDRIVILLYGTVDLQLDSRIPERMKLFKKYSIPKMSFHRVITDNSFLVLIKEI